MIRSVSAAALLLAGAAFAQAPGEAPPFPVQNDLPEGWEMNGAPVPLDILGVKIGMARAEAQAAAVAGMEVDASAGRLEEEETGISGDYGISAFFRYPWGVFVEKSSADSSDSLSLTLSTGVSGERVIAATRETRWQGEAQPRRGDLIESILKKYGEPSFGDPNSSNPAFSFQYVYHKGEKAVLPAGGNWAAKRVRDGSANGCLFDAFGDYRYSYEPEPPNPAMGPRRERLMEKKDCSLVMTVNIYMSQTPGLVRSMEIQMQGLARKYENYISTDRFLEEQLKAKVDGEGPVESKAPKL